MKPDVEGIFVVNLDARPERWALFSEGASSWQAAFGKVPQRFSATVGIELPGYNGKPWFSARSSEQRKRSWAGKAGCILSHRSVIQRAADQGWDKVLVVEDDAFMTEEMARAWGSGLRTLVSDLPADWSAIYLCTTTPIPPCRAVEASGGIRLVEASGALGTVAYLLNGMVFDRVLDELPDEHTIWPWVARYKTIDRWFSQNLLRFGKVYLFAPSIAGHQTGSSDTSMTSENDHQLDFSLRRISYVQGGRAFLLRKWFRLTANAARQFFSIFRLWIKQLRGL